MSLRNRDVAGQLNLFFTDEESIEAMAKKRKKKAVKAKASKKKAKKKGTKRARSAGVKKKRGSAKAAKGKKKKAKVGKAGSKAAAVAHILDDQIESAAQAMGKKQREISISEFFAKNRHLLGFDNPRKALLTTVKEAVDNSLDACEEAHILPELEIGVKQVA